MVNDGEFKECHACGRFFRPQRPEQRFHNKSCARQFEQALRANEPSAVEKMMLAIRHEFEKVFKR